MLKSYRFYVLVFVLVGGPLLACGPNFPNMLLNGGDGAVLVAPVANFRAELERMDLVNPRFPTLLPTNGYAAQTLDAELKDLRLALSRREIPLADLESIVERHQGEREKILFPAGKDLGMPNPNDGLEPEIVEGLPLDFADYFRGSIAWHRGEIGNARAAWEALLERKTENRHFKSTWAAFMLGKAELAAASPNWTNAIRYFSQVRQLVSEGYADALGLAASSVGWEAQAHFYSGNYVEAINLYLEQAAGNDSSAVISLQWAAARALGENKDAISRLAAHPRVQPVITAYVISSIQRGGFDPTSPRSARVLRWLEAVEAANVSDVDSAERLALASYQAGEMEIAQRWLKRADMESGAAQWLQAKLLLYKGEVSSAATVLAKLVHQFPAQTEASFDTNTASLADTLWIRTPGSYRAGIPARDQMLGELGVIRLARREYVEALDALLRSGFWIDAAYLAERVLTVDELRDYVDRNWPLETGDQAPDQRHRYWAVPLSLNETRSDLRYLLARRLSRAGRDREAVGYYPEKWGKALVELAGSLKLARDVTAQKAERASAWFEAAKVTRTIGLELYGTEVEPDWHVYGGNYKYGVTVESRRKVSSESTLRPAADEIERATKHSPEPEKRFHYRYVAASLAMKAANLMPDNDDETARVLCVAGSWLKVRDPKAADVFYKALVRRCRKTVIGAEADRIRWFPRIDEEGKLLPPKPRPAPKLEPPFRLPLVVEAF